MISTAVPSRAETSTPDDFPGHFTWHPSPAAPAMVAPSAKSNVFHRTPRRRSGVRRPAPSTPIKRSASAKILSTPSDDLVATTAETPMSILRRTMEGSLFLKSPAGKHSSVHSARRSEPDIFRGPLRSSFPFFTDLDSCISYLPYTSARSLPLIVASQESILESIQLKRELDAKKEAEKENTNPMIHRPIPVYPTCQILRPTPRVPLGLLAMNEPLVSLSMDSDYTSTSARVAAAKAPYAGHLPRHSQFSPDHVFTFPNASAGTGRTRVQAWLQRRPSLPMGFVVTPVSRQPSPSPLTPPLATDHRSEWPLGGGGEDGLVLGELEDASHYDFFEIEPDTVGNGGDADMTSVMAELNQMFVRDREEWRCSQWATPSLV
ncbi:hypothetical protein BC828DRAFT_385549 [Blastocladiella britannica]|nr:hypothetical protein BC828DRAFT_385549 [Blastocladiella britannica]